MLGEARRELVSGPVPGEGGVVEGTELDHEPLDGASTRERGVAEGDVLVPLGSERAVLGDQLEVQLAAKGPHGGGLADGGRAFQDRTAPYGGLLGHVVDAHVALPRLANRISSPWALRWSC